MNPGFNDRAAMRVLRLRLQLHEVNDVDHAAFQAAQMLLQNGNPGERLKGGHVAGAGHHQVRLVHSQW